MSKSKIIASTALITFAFAIVGLSNAVAGEKIQIQCRGAKYTMNVQAIPVGDEEGHVLVLAETIGIHFNLKGKPFMHGWSHRDMYVWDTGTNSGHGYEEIIDKDGDKIYMAFDGQGVDGGSKGTWTFFKGTGKFEGISGKGTWTSYGIAPKQLYADWEGEVELP